MNLPDYFQIILVKRLKTLGMFQEKKNYVLPAFKKVNKTSALSKIREILRREQEKKLFYEDLGKKS